MISGLDFLAIPSRDPDRTQAFYVETLGLRPDHKARYEFCAGDTCFAIWEPERVGGGEFAPQRLAHIALHVDDIEAAQAELGPRASSSSVTPSTPVSATWPSSATRTATT